MPLFRRPPINVPTISLYDAVSNPAGLFGDQFADASWMPWRVALAALEGRPLDAQALHMLRLCTGRQNAPTEPVREFVAIVGRRGGKSRIGAVLAIEAACFRDWRSYLAPGEVCTIAIIAADRPQARTVFSYIRGLLESIPMLRQRITRQTAHTIELTGKVRIEVTTASARTTRGYSFGLVCADEAAFWRSETTTEPDSEVIAAIRPGMTTLPGSRLVIISSPYARRGVLWEAFRAHYGKENDPVLVWKGSTLLMNPSIDQGEVDLAYERDAASASAEYGAEFRTDVEAFLTRELLDAVVVPDLRALPPLSSTSYVAFCDPSGGAQDAMTMAIAHSETHDRHLVAVLDLVAARVPPFSPESVVKEFAKLMKTYNVHCVTGDRYSGEWCREAFSRHGIAYVVSEQTKSQLYAELLPLITSQRVALLDHPKLLQEALGLERRTARGGRDSIDHGPHGHDDLVNAAAGACVLAVAGGEVAVACSEPEEWKLRTALRHLSEFGDPDPNESGDGDATWLMNPGDQWFPLPRP
jgi:hypothetical protein